jgi:hypothetical protein
LKANARVGGAVGVPTLAALPHFYQIKLFYRD